jgi:hypothetical protein
MPTRNPAFTAIFVSVATAGMQGRFAAGQVHFGQLQRVTEHRKRMGEFIVVGNRGREEGRPVAWGVDRHAPARPGSEEVTRQTVSVVNGDGRAFVVTKRAGQAARVDNLDAQGGVFVDMDGDRSTGHGRAPFLRW